MLQLAAARPLLTSQHRSNAAASPTQRNHTQHKHFFGHKQNHLPRQPGRKNSSAPRSRDGDAALPALGVDLRLVDHGLPGDGRGLVRDGLLVVLVPDLVRRRRVDSLVYVPESGVAAEAARLDKLERVRHRRFLLPCSKDVSSSFQRCRPSLRRFLLNFVRLLLDVRVLLD